MSDEPQPPRIHPASIWVIVAVVVAGVLVTVNYSIDHNRKAKAQWASLFGTGEPTKPPFVGKLEEELEATNRDGSTVKLGELKGKVWVASYLYSDCPMGCVANSQNLSEIYEEFGENPKFHMVSFSVDSDSDTPDKVAAFMERQGIDKPDWWYLTAEDTRLEDYMTEYFKLMPSQPVGDPELAKKIGIIQHDLRVVLVDGKANIRGYYDLLNNTEVEGFDKTVGQLNLGRLQRDIRYILDNEMTSAP